MPYSVDVMVRNKTSVIMCTITLLYEYFHTVCILAGQYNEMQWIVICYELFSLFNKYYYSKLLIRLRNITPTFYVV